MAQAVDRARAGPRAPVMMLTYAAALFGISPGTVNGLTRRGPRVRMISYCSNKTFTPPIPEPMWIPTRRGSCCVMSKLASASASFAAATAR